ncbi:unnamed protein product [Brassica rapa subsp. trilocularis]
MWDYFTMKGDVVKPDPNWEEDEIFYCSICDLEWLNNCLGKRYYNTFILLMVFVLLVVMLVWLAGYVSAAMGKFFLFYLVLIKKSSGVDRTSRDHRKRSNQMGAQLLP